MYRGFYRHALDLKGLVMEQGSVMVNGEESGSVFIRTVRINQVPRQRTVIVISHSSVRVK
jgi:hypothetical protein